jgi:hypothetical protein
VDINNIFWHICQLNNWKKIVEDQYFSIVNSGLINAVEKIFVNFTGNTENEIMFLKDIEHKIEIINFTTKYNDYERPCLHKMLEWSQTNKSNILYIHTKGVSRPKNHHVWLWRKMLEKKLVFQYEDCIKKLIDNDIVSINLINGGFKNQKISNEDHCAHFSGNFWWSKTDYIKTLPRIREDITDLSINKQYWLCERWVMFHYPNLKYYEILSTKHKHYYRRSPELKYL